jgi:OOP family OmpA-OmpF porin
MTGRSALHVVSVMALSAAIACASSPPQASIDAPVVKPGANERLAVDHVIVLMDASSSISEDSLFRDEKSLARSFAAAMPEGDYESATIGFGGFERETSELAPFDRGRSVDAVAQMPHLAEGTPIHKALAEAGTALEGKSGRAAVILYSDGALTDEIGRDLDPQLALDAAAALREGYDGKLCLHTVQIGSEPAGSQLLSDLASTTDCGTFRRADGVSSVAALTRFEREVFFGAAPAPDVAAAPRDLDGDGVIDPDDLCPDTPRGAAVDARGCWVVKGLYFATDSAKIEPAGEKGLEELAQVLRANPDLTVELGGHTDATGSDTYNRSLSEKRAAAARSYLVSAGIAEARLQAKGYGESQPAAPNATPDGRRQNRRTEITIVK